MVFCTFWHKSVQFLSISQRNYHTLSAKLKKPVVFAYFPGARSNRSNPTSYSFYLIGLLWSGDLRETSKLQNTVSFGSPLSLPKMENIGCAQPALQCCTLHSLERNHIHLWSNIESNVQNTLKTQGFSSHFGTKVYNSCQYSREIVILYQQNSRKPVFLYIFQGLVQIEAIPHPIASIWLDCFEAETLETSKLQNTLVWVSFVFAKNGKHWLCSTCLAMLHTAQFREESYSFVVKHWVKRSKQVENAGFFFTFWHKSVQFLSISQRNFHTLSAKFKKTCVFVYFPGARSNRSNPTSYSFYLIGLLWSGDLRETSTAKHCLVWVSFVFAQNGKHWSCSTCLAMLHTAQFREGSLICGQTLSQKFKTSWKRIFFCTFWHKSAQFLSISQRNYHTLSAKLKKNRCFCIFSRGSFK